MRPRRGNLAARKLKESSNRKFSSSYFINDFTEKPLAAKYGSCLLISHPADIVPGRQARLTRTGPRVRSLGTEVDFESREASIESVDGAVKEAASQIKSIDSQVQNAATEVVPQANSQTQHVQDLLNEGMGRAFKQHRRSRRLPLLALHCP